MPIIIFTCERCKKEIKRVEVDDETIGLLRYRSHVNSYNKDDGWKMIWKKSWETPDMACESLCIPCARYL